MQKPQCVQATVCVVIYPKTHEAAAYNALISFNDFLGMLLFTSKHLHLLLYKQAMKNKNK